MSPLLPQYILKWMTGKKGGVIGFIFFLIALLLTMGVFIINRWPLGSASKRQSNFSELAASEIHFAAQKKPIQFDFYHSLPHMQGVLAETEGVFAGEKIESFNKTKTTGLTTSPRFKNIKLLKADDLEQELAMKIALKKKERAKKKMKN